MDGHERGTALADSLGQFGGERAFATRLTLTEGQCRKASRLIRAMLRHVNPSDVLQIPPET
jgi:hypothetical protein